MRFATRLLLFASCLCGVVSGQEPAPGQSLRLTVDSAGGPVELNFRYCPAGTLRPGKPAKPQRDPVDVEPFYILETEVTIDAFAKVMGQPRLDKIKQRSGRNLRDLLDNAQLPAFYLDFDDVSEFCQRITESIQQQAQSGSQLEIRSFRLPTHIEWQYACRATPTAEEGDAFPHFSNWPASVKVLDRNSQSKCLEEWQEMGRRDEFTGSQEQVAAIITARHKPGNPKPLEILRAFLKVGIGTERDYATTPDPPPLVPPRSTKPNSWSIFEMHSNVREWTLFERDQAKAVQTWAGLLNEETRGKLQRKGLFFLSGGSFVDHAFGRTGWQKFTIWGGFTTSIAGEEVGLITRTGSIVPFSLQDLSDSDLLDDQVPGFRIVMTRALRTDWQKFVRNVVVDSDNLTDQSFAQFGSYRDSVQRLSPSIQRAKAVAWVDYYAALAATRLGKVGEARQLLQGESVRALREADPYFAALADLVGKP